MNSPIFFPEAAMSNLCILISAMNQQTKFLHTDKLKISQNFTLKKGGWVCAIL